MTHEQRIIECASCILIAEGRPDPTLSVDPEELWPYAIIVDQDNGRTILSALEKVPKNSDYDPLEISSCAVCEKEVFGLDGDTFLDGSFVTLEPTAGRTYDDDEPAHLGFFMCATCKSQSPDDPVRFLVSKLLGDFSSLRYIKVD